MHKYLTAAGLLTFYCFIAAVGCKEASKPSERLPPGLPQQSRAMRHDFGLVRSGTTHEHDFRVANSSGYPWIVEEMHTSCGCTAALVTKTTISPGGELRVNVRYKAKPRPTDDMQTVELLLREGQQFKQWLRFEVSSKVRDEITLEHPDITLDIIRNCSQPLCRTSTFRVFNYGSPWGSLKAFSDAKWTTCVTTKSQIDPNSLPCETWECTLRVDATLLPNGSHSAILVFEGLRQDSKADAQMPVCVRIRPPVRAMPSQVFLGDMCVRESRRVSVQLFFDEDLEREVKVRHDLNGFLETTIERVDNHNARLSMVATAPNSPGMFRGVVTVFEQRLGELRIPVHAQVLRSARGAVPGNRLSLFRGFARDSGGLSQSGYWRRGVWPALR